MPRVILTLTFLLVASNGGVGDDPLAQEQRTVRFSNVAPEWQGLYQTPIVIVGNQFSGSACPVGPYDLFTAWHVVENRKNNETLAVLWPVPRGETTLGYEVSIYRTWKEHDVALLRVLPQMKEGQPEYVPLPRWFERASKLPLIGSRALGVHRIGPTLDHKDSAALVPADGMYVGTTDDGRTVLATVPSGNGTSGSCLVDSSGKVFAIGQSLTFWTRPVEGGILYDRITKYIPLLNGMWDKGWDR